MHWLLPAKTEYFFPINNMRCVKKNTLMKQLLKNYRIYSAALKTLMKWSCEVIKRDNDEY